MKIDVTINLEDADLTAAESKATYEKIKEYIQKTYGFQVTSLQIAQTKRKLGLPIGDNYNLSKKKTRLSRNARRKRKLLFGKHCGSFRC